MMEADYSAAYARLYREHWWWRVRETILVEKLRELLKGMPTARILDVGCGEGVFFDALEEFGCPEGLESDRAAVERSGRWRSRIVVGELDVTFVPGHPFDLILMLDVLEHVQHPEPVLRRAVDLLTPAGRVLATVPAFDCLWTSHDDINHHVKRYTSKEIRALMNRAGLRVDETHYLFQSLVVPKLLVRAKEALAPARGGIPRIPSPAINRALQAWFRSEHAVAGWLPFGSSVMAVAQRA